MGYPELAQERAAIMVGGYNAESDMNITIFLEETDEDWTAAEFREKQLEKLRNATPMKRKDIRRSERDGMAVLECLIPKFQGMKIDQQNMNVFLVRDGFWVDVHVSKAGFKEQDRKLFEAILGSIRIEE
jgi:hypothetical protein